MTNPSSSKILLVSIALVALACVPHKAFAQRGGGGLGGGGGFRGGRGAGFHPGGGGQVRGNSGFRGSGMTIRTGPTAEGRPGRPISPVPSNATLLRNLRTPRSGRPVFGDARLGSTSMSSPNFGLRRSIPSNGLAMTQTPPFSSPTFVAFGWPWWWRTSAWWSPFWLGFWPWWGWDSNEGSAAEFEPSSASSNANTVIGNIPGSIVAPDSYAPPCPSVSNAFQTTSPPSPPRVVTTSEVSWFGVDGSPSDAGLAVHSVRADSPAARIGIRPGDIVVRINCQEIRGTQDVESALANITGTIWVSFMIKGAWLTDKKILR